MKGSLKSGHSAAASGSRSGRSSISLPPPTPTMQSMMTHQGTFALARMWSPAEGFSLRLPRLVWSPKALNWRAVESD